MINQAESLIDSKEREKDATSCAETRGTDISNNRRTDVLSVLVGFRARFSHSCRSPPVTSPSSWSPSLDFLRIRLEEAINHLVARTDGSQFGEHFYLTAARRTFRTLRIIQFYAFSRITKHRDVCFYSSQIRKKQFGCLRFKSSNL